MFSYQAYCQLLAAQEQLDTYIQARKTVPTTPTALKQAKILALLVEIGEFANETRCFKYWSQKEASPLAKQLDEYADICHFIFSLQLTAAIKISAEEFDQLQSNLKPAPMTISLLHLYQAVITFMEQPVKARFIAILSCWLGLGLSANFDEAMIVNAYHAKNQHNYQRQNTGY